MGKHELREKKTVEDEELGQPEPIFVVEKPPPPTDEETDPETASSGSSSITKYRFFAPLLAIGLVITGSLNTIVAKFVVRFVV